jgi:hypothetical protein
MFLLFEFLVKWGKNEDLKKKDSLLGLSKEYKEHPASAVERHIKKRNFNFGANE